MSCVPLLMAGLMGWSALWDTLAGVHWPWLSPPSESLILNLHEQYAVAVEHLDDLSNADDCHGCITHHLLTLPEANALRQQLDAVPDESPYMRTVVRDWQSPTFRLRPGGLQYWYFNHLVAGGSVTARWEFDGGAHVYFAKSGSAPVPVGHSASAHGTRGFQVPQSARGALFVPPLAVYVVVRPKEGWLHKPVRGHVTLQIRYNLLNLTALQRAGLGSQLDWPPSEALHRAIAAADYPLLIHEAPPYHRTRDMSRLHGGDTFTCYKSLPGRARARASPQAPPRAPHTRPADRPPPSGADVPGGDAPALLWGWLTGSVFTVRTRLLLMLLLLLSAVYLHLLKLRQRQEDPDDDEQ